MTTERTPMLTFGEYADMMIVSVIKLSKVGKTMDVESARYLRTRKDRIHEYLQEKMIHKDYKMVRDIHKVFDELEVVNGKLWDVMDQVRNKPSKKVCFKVIELNDKRVALKNQLNTMVGDEMEVKF